MMYEPSGQWAQPWARLVLQLAADSIPLEYWFQRALNKNVVLWFSDLITSIRAINELISLRGSKTQRQWNATAIVLRGCANTAFPEAVRNGYQPSPVPSSADPAGPLWNHLWWSVGASRGIQLCLGACYTLRKVLWSKLTPWHSLPAFLFRYFYVLGFFLYFKVAQSF